MSEIVAPPKRGRIAGPATKKATILLEPDLLDWGKHQPGGLSDLVRRLIREARAKASPADADDYWIRLGEQGRASGHLSAEETMRFIQERLDRDERRNGQA